MFMVTPHGVGRCQHSRQLGPPPSAVAELEKNQNKLDKIIADFIDSEESNEVLKKAMKSTIEKLQTEIDERSGLTAVKLNLLPIWQII